MPDLDAVAARIPHGGLPPAVVCFNYVEPDQQGTRSGSDSLSRECSEIRVAMKEHAEGPFLSYPISSGRPAE